MKTIITCTILGLCVATGAGEAEPPAADAPGSPKRFEFAEPHMGTRFQITLYASDKPAAEKAAKAAFARIAELDGIMSDYRPSSELMQLCRKAGGEPARVSEDL